MARFLLFCSGLFSLFRCHLTTEVECDVVRQYGVAQNPSTDSTAAIRAAILDCRKRALEKGPNTRAIVLFPDTNPCDSTGCPLQEDVCGEESIVYVTGSINVTSNMTLRIAPRATLMDLRPRKQRYLLQLL